MIKEKVSFCCSDCGWSTPKWVGQCRECRAWGTIDQTPATPASLLPSAVHVPATLALPISEVDINDAASVPTGEGEFDRVLGGGIVRGGVVLLAGEPGVGKSTLLLEVAARIARSEHPDMSGPVLYVSGEESASQVRLRAERIGAMDDRVLLSADNDLGSILGNIEQVSPSLLIVDSVQTISATGVEGGVGGTTQVRAVASTLIRAAKTRNMPVLLVGHVTKDGGIAGPRVLEHLVDVVCYFDGDRHSRLRLLRTVKNRYGPTDEVGCFEMGEAGIVGLPDPSGLFLSRGKPPTVGACPTVSLEGRRPMPTEIQALVVGTTSPQPRRTTSGVDHSRVAMILAVLKSREILDTAGRDVYVSTVGGARTSEPAADLATAIAIASAGLGVAPKRGLIAIGEVGLTGEVRQCVGLIQRLQEAARLGFTQALIPARNSFEARTVEGIDVFPVIDTRAAVFAALP